MKRFLWLFFLIPTLSAKAQTTYYAAWADTNEPIAAQNETAPLLPASSLKILTSYCALKKLGPDHTIPTNFLSETAIHDGEIGNLYVEGRGDPSMVSEQLWLAVQYLKGLGVKKIKGDIVLDDSYFEAKDYPGHQDNNERAYNALLSATSLNYNTVTVQVNHPDGAPPTVALFPNIPYFQVENHLRVGGKGAKIIVGTRFTGSQEILIVSGSVPAHPLGGPAVYFRSIQYPALFFGHSLKTLLLQSGIEVGGNPKKGSADGKHLLFSFASKPLREMVQNMNKFSNNFMAEQIVRYLGAQTSGTPGTTEKGVAVLKQCFKEAGGNADAIHIENGSGLSYQNKIAAKELVRVLLAAYHDFSLSPELISSLSVDGRDGTMKKRRSPKELEGILRAKTGSLNGTSSVAGFVPSRDGRLIAFAILVNNYKGGLWNAHTMQDKLIMEWRTFSKK